MMIYEYDGEEMAEQEAEHLMYIIKAADVGKSQVQCLVGVHFVPVPFYQFMGRVQAHDVGKLALFNGKIWQVENAKQRDVRLSLGR